MEPSHLYTKGDIMNDTQFDLIQKYTELEKGVNDNFVAIASVLRKYQEHIEVLHKNMDALNDELQALKKPKLILPGR